MEWIIAQLSTPLPASEGTGDSETNNDSADDRGFGCIQEGAVHDDELVVVDDDDDDGDAESCSHDSYGGARIESGWDDGDGDDDDGAHGVDEEGVFVWLQRMKSDEEEEENKVVDSEDDDRLFWETCLASGYP